MLSPMAKQPAEGSSQPTVPTRTSTKAFLILALLGLLSQTCAAQDRKGGVVAVLNSGATNKIYRKKGADYRLIFNIWLAVIGRQALEFKIITDKDLETNHLTDYSVLVLPGSVALSDSELNSIQNFVRSGGGLLIQGASGVLRTNGSWRGWDFIKELVGLSEIRALKKKEYKSLYLTLGAGSPITLNLPTGLRLENLFYNENYAGISEKQDAYWSEQLKPLYVSDRNTYYTAIKTARYGDGRVCWFGFNIESISEQPVHQRILLTLFENTLRWLKKEPVVQIAFWPGGKRKAVGLTFDCESNFENLVNLLDRQDAKSLRFTFFMLSSMAQRFPELVRRAATIGEVAIHGDDHSAFRRQSYQTQFQRLRRAREKLQSLAGGEVISFRPPFEEFDKNTLLVLKDLGIRNFFSDYTNSSSPNFQALPQAGSAELGGPPPDLISLPRPNYDDYDLFVEHQLSNDQAIEYIFEDLNRVSKEGGLYVLNMHTTAPWGGLTRERIRVLSTLMDRLRHDDDVWVTTVQEASDWWRERSRMELRATKHPLGLKLYVFNRNEKPVSDLVVEVYAPGPLSDGSFRTTDPNPLYYVDSSEQKLSIKIPVLQPGESKQFIVTTDGQTNQR